MTCYYSVKFPDRIEILSDTAITTSYGALWGTRSKIWQIGDLPAVVLSRGVLKWTAAATELVENCFSKSDSVDDGIAFLEVTLAALRGASKVEPGKEAYEVTLCAISESRGPLILWFQSTDNIAGWPAWTLRDVETGLQDPHVMPDWFHEQVTASGTIADKGVYLMEAIRSADSQSISFDHGEATIGGDIDHTVVTANGAETRRIYSWPDDQIGKPLVRRPPQRSEFRRGEALMKGEPEQPTMSRQQRRRAEREARRAA